MLSTLNDAKAQFDLSDRLWFSLNKQIKWQKTAVTKWNTNLITRWTRTFCPAFWESLIEQQTEQAFNFFEVIE